MADSLAKCDSVATWYTIEQWTKNAQQTVEEYAKEHKKKQHCVIDNRRYFNDNHLLVIYDDTKQPENELVNCRSCYIDYGQPTK